MATVEIDEDELKKIKFALVFMTGGYGDIGTKLARSKNKTPDTLRMEFMNQESAGMQSVNRLLGKGNE